MPRRLARLPIAPLVLLSGVVARGDVVVLANRAPTPVSLRVTADGRTRSLTLPPGETRPVFGDRAIRVEHPASAAGGDPLRLNEAYYFALGRDGRLRFGQIGLVGPDLRSMPRGPWPDADALQTAELPVLLVVDDEEPTRESVWRRRLTTRVAKVSKVLERHSGLRLKVAGFARYASDNRLIQFTDALRQFEQTVAPPPGAIAIGFSSQFEVQRGVRRRLGGTRGPLRRHLLVREYSPTVTEAERIEVLAHELGHFLGATHSPEADSVMRPVLGDVRTRLKSFGVKFDAVNTLAIAMVAEELRRRDARSIGELSAGTRLRLGRVYATLGQTLPDDPAAESLGRRVVGPALVARLKRDAVAAVGEAPATGDAVYAGALTRAAVVNSRRDATVRQSGDELTTSLVRAAALAGPKADADGRRRFLLALGLGFDDTGALAAHPRARGRADAVDPPALREARRETIGQPTARGRADTAKHFFVSAALVAVSTPAEADLWGLGKEAVDAQGDSGYSFADLAANRAGIRFAEQVLAGKLPLRSIAAQFEIDRFVPALDGLPEGLAIGEVLERYGGLGDPRFEALRREIDRRIDALPHYALQRVASPR